MKILKKIIKILLCFVMFFSLFLGFSALMVTRTVSDPVSLSTKIVTPEFNENVFSAVRYSLKNKLALVDVVKWEDVSDIITEERIHNEIPGAVISVTERIFNGGGKKWAFGDDELWLRVESKVRDYADSYGLEYKENDAYNVYTLICDTVTAEMEVIPQMYIDAASPAIMKVLKICALWYIPMIVYVAAFIGLVVIGRHHVKRTLYNLVLPSYLALFATFSVSYLMYRKDYLANIVIGNRNFQHFLRSIYNAVMGDMSQTALVLSIMFLIMGIVISVMLAIRDEDRRGRRAKKHRHRHRHHRHHGENKGFEIVEAPADFKGAVDIEEIIKIDENLEKSSDAAEKEEEK